MLSRILFQKLKSSGHSTPPQYKLQKDLNEAKDSSIHTVLKILPKAFTAIVIWSSWQGQEITKIFIMILLQMERQTQRN